MAFNFETFPVLQTPRVTLRALKLDDAEPLLALRSSEEINKFVITKSMQNLEEAKDLAIDVSNSTSQQNSISERGMKFRTLVENCSLEGKPEQVLGALHFLRDVEGLDDCPPRVINALFEQANIEPPGNLSLYINRLIEKEFLSIPKKHGEKNRFAELTEAGRKHLENKAKK